MKLNLFYRLPLALFCGFIFWQSGCPSLISEPLFPHDDKVMHLAAYALMALLAARWIPREKKGLPLSRIKILALLFASFYGLSDEIHQAFVPSRSASVMDWAADILGALLGVWIYGRVRSGKNPVSRVL
ncbi:VanZ family protein [Desulfospira joergensenii]|uniref:VanZ family protein n=1 Tax=Desulfospira joergensenii TaxID=53329 RepID=UPI0003B3ADA3|nr:VanZ family protein [Desulfospira joergensenii]